MQPPAPASLAGRSVVVLGGTGFLGSDLVRGFVGAGASVTSVARHRPGADAATRLAGADVILGDVDDQELIASVVAGADQVVYAVGCPFPAESNLDPVGDVDQTLPSLLRVLQALRARPGVRFTFLSSGGTVYGNPERLPVDEDAACWPLTSYGIMKLAAEHYVAMYRMLYGIDGHVVRVANAYGPTQRPGRGQGVVAAFLDAATAGRAVQVFGDGSVVRDYVHVDDVAQAIVALSTLEHLPALCNIGSGTGNSVLEVLQIVEQVTGRRFDVVSLPDRAFDVRAIVLDVSRLAGAIDWSPRPLERGIAETWAALRADRPLVAERPAAPSTGQVA